MDIRATPARCKRVKIIDESPSTSTHMIEMETRAEPKSLCNHSLHTMNFEIEPVHARRKLGGSVATTFYAQRRTLQEQERKRLQQAANTPNVIERMLREHRKRPRRRGPLARVQNPMTLASIFFADPVLRFWFGCNLCTVALLFTAIALSLHLLYPLLLRTTIRY